MGKNEEAGCFYYVMELADDAKEGQASSLSGVDGNSDAKTGKMPVPPYTPRTLRHDLEHRGRLPIADCVQIGLSLAQQPVWPRAASEEGMFFFSWQVSVLGSDFSCPGHRHGTEYLQTYGCHFSRWNVAAASLEGPVH